MKIELYLDFEADVENPGQGRYWIPFSDDYPSWIIIPCKSGKTFLHQWGGFSCYQLEVEGVAYPVNLPSDLRDLLDLEDFEMEDQKAEIKARLATFFETWPDTVDLRGTALAKIGSIYLATENFD